MKTLFLILLLALPLSGYPRQLTHSNAIAGNANFSSITPDSQRLVYLADQETDGRREIFSVRKNGTGLVKLNDDRVIGRGVSRFEFSPDGQWLVFLAVVEGSGKPALFRTSINGSSPLIELLAKVDPLPDIHNFKISPDGLALIYSVETNVAGGSRYDLYTIPSDGGETRKLNGDNPSASNYQISPDGTSLVFQSNQFLYSVPIAGGEIIQISDNLASGVGPILETHLGNRVFFNKRSETNQIELYSAPAAGGFTVLMNAPLPPDAFGISGSVTMNQQGTHILYLADGEKRSRYELYHTAITALGGAEVTKLNTALDDRSDVTGQPTFTNDGAQVLYKIFNDGRVSDLYLVAAQGGPSRKINPPGERVFQSKLTPDNQHILYSSRNQDTRVDNLYSVPIAGGELTLLNEKIPPIGIFDEAGVRSCRITSDSKTVIYSLSEAANSLRQLFSTSLVGGPSTRLNFELEGNEQIFSYQLSPDGSWVSHSIYQARDHASQIYATPATGGPVLRLNSDLVIGGTATPDFQSSTDGRHLYYLADHDIHGSTELFRCDCDGKNRIKLHQNLGFGLDVESFRISPDGLTALYLVSEGPGNHALFSVPSAGGTPTLLTSLEEEYSQFDAFEISLDNLFAIYLKEESQNGPHQVYRVRLDGSETLRLNDDLGEDETIDSFKLSSRVKDILYLEKNTATFEATLFTSALPTGVFTQLSNGGFTTSDYSSIPDGDYIIYLNFPVGDGPGQVYRTSFSGQNTIKLNAPLVLDGDVTSFRISPDSGSIIYRADQVLDGRFELFQARIDGAAIAIPATTSTERYQFTPDGSQLIYESDLVVDGQANIHTLNLINSEDQIVATAPPGTPFQISSDSQSMLYLSGELFQVPLAGGEARQIGGNGISAFQFTPDSRGIIYLADPESDGRSDLFLWHDAANWLAGNGDWSTAEKWDTGLLPDAKTPVFIEEEAVVTLNGEETSIDSLTIGSNGDLKFSNDAEIFVKNQVNLLADGTLRGNGSITSFSPITLAENSHLLAGKFDTLILQAPAIHNSGFIKAIGSDPNKATLSLGAPATNLGSIEVANGFLWAAQSLDNHGVIQLFGESATLVGEIENSVDGSIIIGADTRAIFSANLINRSSIMLLEPTSSITIVGSFSGLGISGDGDVTLEGPVRPGFSAGTMTIDGDVTFDSTTGLEMELGENASDQLIFGGELEIDGTLKVTLLDDLTPQAGMTFDLWEADSVSGNFTALDFAPLPEGLFWNTCMLSSTGEISIAVTPETYAEFAIRYDLDEDNPQLLAYLAGVPPTPTAQFTKFQPTEGGMEFSFITAQQGANDLDLIIETSPDFSPESWRALAKKSGKAPWDAELQINNTPDDHGRQKISITQPTDEVKRFYRLRVAFTE